MRPWSVIVVSNVEALGPIAVNYAFIHPSSRELFYARMYSETLNVKKCYQLRDFAILHGDQEVNLEQLRHCWSTLQSVESFQGSFSLFRFWSAMRHIYCTFIHVSSVVVLPFSIPKVYPALISCFPSPSFACLHLAIFYVRWNRNVLKYLNPKYLLIPWLRRFGN